jgi:hypothetical protein
LRNSNFHSAEDHAFENKETWGLFKNNTLEGVFSIQDRPIEFGRPRLEKERGRRHNRLETEAAWRVTIADTMKLADVSE